MFEKRYPLRIPKFASRSVRHLLGHTVFQLGKSDEQGGSYSPHGYAKLSLEFNRALIERGIRAPWMWSAERCQQFWATREPGAGSNTPNSYAAKPTEIVDFMHHLWGSDVDRTDKVLEIGCSAGANLDRLRQLGYSSLSGIEINPHAIAELSRVFPELRESMIVHTGRIEDVLPSIEAGGVDVVFAMAVLHHIHPSSNWVFAEMVRVAAHHVFVIEPEQIISQYIFCRDYSRVFEALGCQQLRAVEINRSSLPEVAEVYHGYTARLFRVPGA